MISPLVKNPLLPRYPLKPYIRSEKRENNAMTIAIGFRCVDGIVLCADTQITSRAVGMKYSEDKIHTIANLGETNWIVGITYSGDVGILKSFHEKLSNTLLPKRNDIALQDVREAIQSALFEVHNNSADINTEYIDVICGVSIGGKKPESAMYVCRRTTVHEERDIAFAGVGDSSLSKFLLDVLPVRGRGIETGLALLLSTYIVGRAKEFVDGCGGNTQSLIIRDGGESNLLSGDGPLFRSDKPELLAESINKCVRSLLEVLLVPYVEASYLHKSIDKLKKEINEFYGFETFG